MTVFFAEFIRLSRKPRVNLPELLANFETDVRNLTKDYGFNPKLFPLLRKAARSYVDGNLSRQSLEAMDYCLDECYVDGEFSEEELLEKLRCFISAAPSNDKRIAAKRRSHAAQLKELHASQQLHRKAAPVKFSEKTATTPTGVVLRLVR
jgi:hypothetical protein